MASNPKFKSVIADLRPDMTLNPNPYPGEFPQKVRVLRLWIKKQDPIRKASLILRQK